MEDYIPYSFPPNFWYRNRRPLIEEDQTHIRKISHSSPLSITLAIASWIAVKIIPNLVQTSGDIADWSANRRRVKAEAAVAVLREIEKIADIEYKQIRNRQSELLLEQTEYAIERARLEHADYEEQREKRQNNALNQIKRRLARNPHQLEDIDIQWEEKQT